MKTLGYILGGIAVMTLLVLTVSFALACDSACYSDGKPFCGPDDEECVYDTCSETADPDTDSDGWTDVCDAFPEDAAEWVDLDGDGCGHNEDENDLDNTVVCPEEDSGDEDEPEIPPPKKSSGSSGHSGGSWPDRCESDWDCVSDCDAGTISCVDLNACDNGLNKPTEPECPEEPLILAVPPVSAEPQPPAKPIFIAPEPQITPLPIAQDTGSGFPLINPAWFAALLLLVPLLPLKECSKCKRYNALARQKCHGCHSGFYRIRKGTFLYKVRHMPFLLFKGFR